MPVILSKGESVSLKKINKSQLTGVRIGMGWTLENSAVDLDVHVVAYQGIKPIDHVYYGNEVSSEGADAIYHHGDNLVGGDGESDDEVVDINLDDIPHSCSHILIAVDIYSARSRGQSFASVKKAYLNVKNCNNECLASYDLADIGSSNSTVCATGVLYRNPDDIHDWMFKPLDQLSSAIGDLKRTFRMSGQGITLDCKHNSAPTQAARIIDEPETEPDTRNWFVRLFSKIFG